MNTKLLQNTVQDIQTAGAIIAQGGLVAIPTETVYGLGANALNAEAVKKIFIAKGRPQDNPLIVHISDVAQLTELVRAVPPKATALIKAFWPGPLTIILPKTDLVPPETSGGLKTVAVRFPASITAQKIIIAAGVPIAAPSANTSGLPSPTTAQHVLRDMDGKIDAVLDDGACSVGVESTVITLATEVPRLLRPGGIALEQLQSVIGEVAVDPSVFSQLEAGAVAASPGMKYKHYAPSADVHIIKGSFAQYKEYVEAMAQTQKGVFALCFQGEEAQLTVPCVPYGAQQNEAEQAHALFDALRQLDERGARLVFARCPRQEGMGMAVYNRLLRAAAHQITALDPLFILGITGPTGSGKSAVSRLLEQRGYVIIDADVVAKEAVQAGSPLLPKLAQAFGDTVIVNGELDRKELARLAFASKQKEELLNALTHPAIIARCEELVANWFKMGYTKFVLDVPLLFESKMDALCDKTIAVLADKTTRMQRIMKRDSLTKAQAEQRISIQNADAFYKEKADFILENKNLSQLESALNQFLGGR